MASRSRFFALFLLSTALIMYEIAAMRMFAVTSWSNFGSLVISTALLGFGLAGTLLTFIGKQVQRSAPAWLYWSATIFMPALALAHIIGQRIPFNPIFIGSDATQLLWIGLYYVVYGVPFFFGAFFIGIAFLDHEGKIHRLYFWNMLGSSVGGFAVIPLMYLLPPASLVLPVIVLACGASLVSALVHEEETRRWTMPAGQLVGTAAAFVVSVVLVFASGEAKVSDYKPISYIKKYPDAVEVHRSWSPIGEMNVFASSSLHFAPGLSDNAVLSLKTMPRQPFWAMYNDGNGPVGIMGALRSDEAAYMDWLPMAAPYVLLDRPRVLLVNLGGGISAQVARYKGAASITDRGARSRGDTPARQGSCRLGVHRPALEGSPHPSRAGRTPRAQRIASGRIRPCGDQPRGFRRPVRPGRLSGDGELHLDHGGPHRVPGEHCPQWDALHHGLGPAGSAAQCSAPAGNSRGSAPGAGRGGSGRRGSSSSTSTSPPPRYS